MFEVGDIVTYDPPYHVEGVWLENVGKEYHVVKATGSNSTMLVAEMNFIGLHEHEIPSYAIYRLAKEAFKVVLKKEPEWTI